MMSDASSDAESPSTRVNEGGKKLGEYFNSYCDLQIPRQSWSLGTAKAREFAVSQDPSSKRTTTSALVNSTKTGFVALETEWSNGRILRVENESGGESSHCSWNDPSIYPMLLCSEMTRGKYNI
eukprot:scaffold40393_cov199-Amphora_coffeaeformis.AAC.3